MRACRHEDSNPDLGCLEGSCPIRWAMTAQDAGLFDRQKEMTVRTKQVVLGALVTIIVATFIWMAVRPKPHIEQAPFDPTAACQQKWDQMGLQSSLGDAGYQSYMASCVSAASR